MVDTGIGMAKDVRDKLFVHLSPSSKGTNDEIGTGLGLILVKDFVTQHGGHIQVESVEGEGTCFKFTMPAFVNKANKALSTHLSL